MGTKQGEQVMTVGIVPNTQKEKLLETVNRFLALLKENNIDFLFYEGIKEISGQMDEKLNDEQILSIEELGKRSDVIVSLGGDGTMLYAAHELRSSNAPLMGLNLGKLGFLAEFDIDSMDDFIMILKEKRFVIEERMALSAICQGDEGNDLYAINDVVIDKGKWQRMIEISITVDGDYVSTFAADGLIIATPTGSTGYSLSTGGPVVHPSADVITLSPISPHSLTMRPLVISSKQRITVEVKSQHENIQINCDGQRVYNYSSPISVEVFKSDNPVRLVHSIKSDYFQTLRNKLYWGLDVRKNNSIQ